MSAYLTGTWKVLSSEKEFVNDSDLGTGVDKFAVNNNEAAEKGKDMVY